MGRLSHAQRLNIWMNGALAGFWESRKGEDSLGYHEEWVSDEQGRPLSLSLPFTANNQVYRGAVVADYFDNLLPDRISIRKRLATRYHTNGTEAFALLSELGRDCVGAIQLLPPDIEPVNLYSITGDVQSEADIARRLRNTTSTESLGPQDEDDGDLRLSIAGAQEKTALLWHEGRWLFPHGSTPTTHIFKLPIGLVGNMKADMRSSVENEWLCSKIVKAYGLPIARCEIARFEDQKALIVERFDRRLASDNSWLLRLPQEDMCQATGTPSLRKYQSHGGPGIAEIMEILSGSITALDDRVNFFKAQLIFWILAATDGHAKNFSIALKPGGNFQATPLYDVLSAHPIIGTAVNMLLPQQAKMAMSIRGTRNHYHIHKIKRRHWLNQANAVLLGTDVAEAIIEDVVESTEKVIEQASALLPDGFPQDIADAIFNGMRNQQKKLAEDCEV